MVKIKGGNTCLSQILGSNVTSWGSIGLKKKNNNKKLNTEVEDLFSLKKMVDILSIYHTLWEKNTPLTESIYNSVVFRNFLEQFRCWDHNHKSYPEYQFHFVEKNIIMHFWQQENLSLIFLEIRIPASVNILFSFLIFSPPGRWAIRNICVLGFVLTSKEMEWKPRPKVIILITIINHKRTPNHTPNWLLCSAFRCGWLSS